MKQKQIITAVVIVFLLSLGVGAFLYYNSHKDKKVGDDYRYINYSGPTEEESAAADQQKENNISRSDLEEKYKAPTSVSPQKVDVQVTSSGQYDGIVEARATVTGIYETGGKCTATYTQGSRTVEVVSDAIKDAKTLQCGALDKARSEFPQGGNWSLVVSYSSAVAKGQSDPVPVKLD